MNKYYISSFDFFYATKYEDLGNKFCKDAFGGSFPIESDVMILEEALQKIANAFEKNQKEFEAWNIDISDLISGVLKRDYSDLAT